MNQPTQELQLGRAQRRIEPAPLSRSVGATQRLHTSSPPPQLGPLDGVQRQQERTDYEAPSGIERKVGSARRSFDLRPKIGLWNWTGTHPGRVAGHEPQQVASGRWSHPPIAGRHTPLSAELMPGAKTALAIGRMLQEARQTATCERRTARTVDGHHLAPPWSVVRVNPPRWTSSSVGRSWSPSTAPAA
jgi:hypothetical protein